MAVTYNTTLKNTRLTAVVTAIGASGKIEIGTAGMASVLATITLGNPAGTVAGGVLTFSGFPRSDPADAVGTAEEARIRDGSNNDIVTGLTVGTTGGNNIVLDTVSILLGQTVRLASATITHG